MQKYCHWLLTSTVQYEGIVLHPLDFAEELIGAVEGALSYTLRQGVEIHGIDKVFLVRLR